MNKAEKIAAIVAITQLFKEYGVETRFCPFIAIAIGALLGYSEEPNSRGILDGILLGAMATGGYAVVKGSAQEVIKKPRSSNTFDLEHDDYRGI